MQEEFIDVFCKSTKAIIEQMTDIKLGDESAPYKNSDNILTKGVVTIVSFAGKLKGRLLIDIEHGLMMELANNVIGEQFASLKDRSVLAVATEINNIIAGDANTVLNNEYKLGLRLAPPVVFTGENAIVSISKINSISVEYKTEYGNLRINVAFEGSA